MVMVFLASLLVGVLGLLIGSFLNVVILRLPSGKTLGGRSACPHCQYQLRAVDLVPVISYVYLRGRCRRCAQSISPRYPIIELLVAALFLLCYFHSAPVDAAGYVLLLQAWLVAAVCVVTFVVDFEHYLILDRVTFGGLVGLIGLKIVHLFVGHLVLWSWHSVLFNSFVGALIGFIPFFLLWFLSRGKLMGLGDVKFMIFAGFALGWPNIVVALLLAFWLGALVALPLLILGKKSLGSRLPFGTFLAIAVLIAFLYGDSLWHWYVSLLVVG